jgi:hypothetical protein
MPLVLVNLILILFQSRVKTTLNLRSQFSRQIPINDMISMGFQRTFLEKEKKSQIQSIAQGKK